MTNEKFRELVIAHVPCHGDVNEALDEFFTLDYTIIELKGNGLIGYTEHEDYYCIWFAYNDGFHSNTKTLYNTAKQFNKQVLYTGVKDLYYNNSTEIQKDLYKLN